MKPGDRVVLKRPRPGWGEMIVKKVYDIYQDPGSSLSPATTFAALWNPARGGGGGRWYYFNVDQLQVIP